MYISLNFGPGVHVFCWEVGVLNRSCFRSVSCKIQCTWNNFLLKRFQPVQNNNYTPCKRSCGGGIYRNHPVCLFVRLSVQSKLNLGYNFWTKWDRTFILHMCILCIKTFLLFPKILTSWPWLDLLFKKNLTLAITFEPEEVRLSY